MDRRVFLSEPAGTGGHTVRSILRLSYQRYRVSNVAGVDAQDTAAAARDLGQVRAFLRSIRARVLSPRRAEGGNSHCGWRSFRLGYGRGRGCQVGGGLREMRLA